MKTCGKYARITLYMYLPEYTITSETLKNIGIIEYSKAVVETTTVLPSWEKQMRKDAHTIVVTTSLKNLGMNVSIGAIKKHVDGLVKSPMPEIANILKALDLLEDLAKNAELDEPELKYIHKILTDRILPKTKTGSYRTEKNEGKPKPEEILANLVQVFDWYNSMDARETHPVIKIAIFRAMLEQIAPFETYNRTAIDLMILLCLMAEGYSFKSSITLVDYYDKTERQYNFALESCMVEDHDLTGWIEYFTEGYANEASVLKEKAMILEKNTKVAKATGRVNLSSRQEQIVAYLQDYGTMQNKHFQLLFPSISEDSVLRDLKSLIEQGIVVKRGSTKSSRYELK